MKPWNILLSAVFLCSSVAGFSQQGGPSAPAPASNLRVIVPWTHFGQSQPAVTSPGPPAPSAVNPGSSDTTSGPTTPQAAAASAQPAPPQDEATTQAAATAPAAQLYEADISKKHPHPPEPVSLPPAQVDVPPLVSLNPEEVPPAPASLTPVPVAKPNTGSASLEPGSGSAQQPPAMPEADIAAVSAAYAARRAARESRLQQLRASTSGDPAAQASARLEETRLELEGEQDLMDTSQKLASDYAALANEFDQRALKISGLINDRKQIEKSSEVQIAELNQRVPREKIALQNLAQLPADSGTDPMIQSLQADLLQAASSEKVAAESAQEAQQEIASLEAEVGQLGQAAAKARQEASLCAAAVSTARANEDRLADRMEYYKAQQQAAALLAGASKALDSPAPVAMPADAAPAAATAQPSPGPLPQGQGAGSLRDCIRKTGKVDACLAQQGSR